MEKDTPIQAERISELRKYLAVSREEMAAVLGYSAGQLGRYERGEQLPTEIFYKVICERYQICKEYFEGTVSLSDALNDSDKRTIDWKKVGKRVKEIRSNMQMSQNEFADYIGCAKGTIAQAEATGKGLSDRLIEYISDFCDVGKEWILYGDEKKKDFPVNEDMIHYLWKNEEIRKELWEKMMADQ